MAKISQIVRIKEVLYGMVSVVLKGKTAPFSVWMLDKHIFQFLFLKEKNAQKVRCDLKIVIMGCPEQKISVKQRCDNPITIERPCGKAFI